MEVKTNSGAVVVLKDFITGRDFLELQKVFLSGITVEAGEMQKSLTGDKLVEGQKKAIEIAVVSVNGSTENVYELLLDLPKNDYVQVMAEVDKITSAEEKKTVGENN